tara:strand:+ start:698 stop:838 length:141 start_codon:yes stop_codon:yes gene_type:complete
VASLGKIYKVRLKLKNKKAGKKRKAKLAKNGSTPTKEAVFEQQPVT